MNTKLETHIKSICRQCGGDRTRLMDIALEVQAKFGCVSSEALDLIAQELSMPRVEVESLVSFYAFLSEKPKGEVVIRLCNDVIDEMNGAGRIAQAFSEELGIPMGATTRDGRITLEWAPCIGMSDQAPAALVNEVVVTNLDADKARAIARQVKEKGCSAQLVRTLGDGNNAHDLVRAMVTNNIRMKGPVVFAEFESGTALRKALAMTPAEVIRDIKTSRLRGRGGAGFPTGIKWDFTRQAAGGRKYVICNADEGEPGTFKDRVVLTECPHLMVEGMTIAGYAIGAAEGVIYLRAEYAYLRAFLESVLQDRRARGLLGANIAGRAGVSFDIRIQMGAGAYVCGEEAALLNSCEGRRGDPKTRPPFPAQKGYLGCPTTVNNSETFCCVARILDKGPGWFAQMGTKGSAGTKLLSISGDCRRPGTYEVPFGITVREMLAMAGAEDATAVQIGGPSGRMVGTADYGKTICYDDLATGGSVMIFGPERDVIRIAEKFTEFFLDESCGYCTPCRVGNALIANKLRDILHGRGAPDDLDYLSALASTMKFTSRCGLGQTAGNPVVSTIRSFPDAYAALIAPKKPDDVLLASFDIQAAIGEAKAISGRESMVFEP